MTLDCNCSNGERRQTKRLGDIKPNSNLKVMNFSSKESVLHIYHIQVTKYLSVFSSEIKSLGNKNLKKICSVSALSVLNEEILAEIHGHI